MIKAPISPQELRRRLYRKAKSDKTHRQKRSTGWRRWSNEYLYDVLGLWKVHPLPSAEAST
jgi:hypothetical protein